MIKVIEVTQEDIDRGVRKESCQCPIALALQRCTGYLWAAGPLEACRIGVADSDVEFPRDAKRFIRNFDDGLPVQPFSFEYDEEKQTFK